MNIVKRLVLFTIATFAVIFLLAWSWVTFGLQSPIFAFLANWLVMSWMALNGHVLRFSIAPSYYDIKPFEQSGQVYERLGIRLFKRLFRRGTFTLFSPTLRLPKKRTMLVLRTLDIEMRKAETGHALIFVAMLLFASYALFRGYVGAVAWLILFNILINGYPIMLQRYNRLKLHKLILQKERRLVKNEETREIQGGIT